MQKTTLRSVKTEPFKFIDLFSSVSVHQKAISRLDYQNLRGDATSSVVRKRMINYVCINAEMTKFNEGTGPGLFRISCPTQAELEPPLIDYTSEL